MAKLYTMPTAGGGVVTLRPNYHGIGQMLRYKAFWPPLEAVAHKMKAIAEATAPVATDDRHPGRYKASFEVVRGQRAAPQPRVFARLQNTSPEAIAVEFGTRATRRHGPPHRTMRNAARAMRGL